MRARAVLLVGLVCVALLPAVLPQGGPATVAVLAAALLCALALALVVARPAGPTVAVVTAPADRRRRGRFLQQSRPGVPGRTRARAPGCGR